MAIEPPTAEVSIEASLVRALLQTQHADLASLPLVEAGEGWDNKLYRLGDDLVVRLPRRQLAAALIEHEVRWLPQLAPRLPLRIPVPIRVGSPALGYPWTWVVNPWLPGETAARTKWDDGHRGASRLGEFVACLHQPAPSDAPVNPYRRTLGERSARFAEHLRQLGSAVDVARAVATWEDVLRLPAYGGTPVWLHGDLHPANLVVREGRLEGVIDFGDLTSGDPAIDLAVAWMIWDRGAREAFRTAAAGRTPIDDVTWARARGWALSLAVAYLAHSAGSSLGLLLARVGIKTIAAVLAGE